MMIIIIPFILSGYGSPLGRRGSRTVKIENAWRCSSVSSADASVVDDAPPLSPPPDEVVHTRT